MSGPDPPEPLTTGTVEARVVKQKIWDRLWLDNEHFMGVIVGREGSGKSYTALKLAEVVDPTLTADRVMFEPQAFLERLQEWKAAGETQGKMVVADEAGVGLGVRTWHDRDQVKFNQALQVLRDENMGVIFTLPRLNELDSQARGRLHAFIEMTDKDAGNWAEFRWLNWKPTRDERSKVYREYPRLRIDGHKRRVKRLRVGPPSQELVDQYERRKSTFQTELYEETIDEYDDSDEGDDEMGPQELADEIATNGVGKYVQHHGRTGRPYVDADLLRADQDLTVRDARTVKKLIEKKLDEKELEAHV